MADLRLEHDQRILERPEIDVPRHDPLPGQASFLDRSGFDLVTSRPGSCPSTNGFPELEPVEPRRGGRKDGRHDR